MSMQNYNSGEMALRILKLCDLIDGRWWNWDHQIYTNKAKIQDNNTEMEN